MSKEIKPEAKLFVDVTQLIEQSKHQIAISVNATLSMLYWNIGKKINNDTLQNQRAEYGKQIVVSLSQQLTAEYGKGWGEKQLRQCMQFALVFPDEQILYALRRD
jgi:phosphoribosylformimino-5-aminoimidazole carboxamide ribonucleotide (ProFAR) isomerase